MTRLVTHDENSPLKIDAADVDDEDGDVAICRCGLAESYPFCDGSHRVTETEAEGVLYRYTDGGGDENSDTEAGGGRSRRVVERIVDAEE